MPNDTARGFDAALIEAMARAMASHFSMNRMPHMSGDPLNRLGSQERRRLDDATDAALTALCAARPDVAALLAGEAVAVPRIWLLDWRDGLAYVSGGIVDALAKDFQA